MRTPGGGKPIPRPGELCAVSSEPVSCPAETSSGLYVVNRKAKEKRQRKNIEKQKSVFFRPFCQRAKQSSLNIKHYWEKES